MSFIKLPNLPDDNVKAVLIDGRADEEIVNSLSKHGASIVETCPHPNLYKAVSGHPDMFLHHVGDGRIVYAPYTEKKTLDCLKNLGFELVQGLTELSSKYPRNIAYNVARVGNCAIHNLKYTDRVLRDELEKQQVKLIHVNQGYTKCSVAVVDDNSIITSDCGIARVLEREGIEVLLIEGEDRIVLPGLSMGFIGGSSGKIGYNKMAFTGNLNTLKFGAEIKYFLKRKNIDIVCLNDGQVIDIGTIIPILC